MHKQNDETTKEKLNKNTQKTKEKTDEIKNKKQTGNKNTKSK